ncbi:MAG TPA: hypothetical protein DF774_00500 [Rheinheimera sp.]|jgi:outer membrane scaffolding protein for murein synthesis (MipA/OmpV family)|uniref:MipA/OmpV family protein n=1 Tax=Rheinheimera sp. TaxID=1869214 RepID=UPI000ECF6966|nr:MipA/OmpV family protein [Rheinheimera sp.]HCU64218.1 hypothetical protein [Rheinheimera sp.]
MQPLLSRILCSILLLGPCAVSAAQGEYQLGVGTLAATQPHYPGSAQSAHFVWPVPYFTYRSAQLQIDRQGATGLLAQGEHWALNLSLAGALAVDSDKNQLRQGMPALDWIAEIGPALDVQLTPNLQLRLPVRAAFATDFKQGSAIGWRFEPQLRYQQAVAEAVQWESVLSLAASSKAYHQYFYGVAPEYSLATRPEYSASGGFSGWRFANGLSLRQGDWWFAVYSRYDYLADATVADSPLLVKEHQLSAGFVVVKILKTGLW